MLCGLTEEGFHVQISLDPTVSPAVLTADPPWQYWKGDVPGIEFHREVLRIPVRKTSGPPPPPGSFTTLEPLELLTLWISSLTLTLACCHCCMPNLQQGWPLFLVIGNKQKLGYTKDKFKFHMKLLLSCFVGLQLTSANPVLEVFRQEPS